MKKILILVGVMTMVFCATAATWKDPSTGITWTYTYYGSGVSVGGGDYRSLAVPMSTKGAITIPSIINGYLVVDIGRDAFYGCSKLTSVTIPSGVASIGWYAFYGCSGLTSVSIPSSVTSIGYAAFSGCRGLGDGVVVVDGCVLTVNGTCPAAVELPIGTRLIADGVFQSCTSLTSLSIPSSVTSIGYAAFSGCSGLGDGVVVVDGCVLTVNGMCPTVVELPFGTRLIAGSAFSGCSGLTSVTMPLSVDSVGDQAFYGCVGLESVVMSGGVASKTEPGDVAIVGEAAFQECRALTSVTMPRGVTSIGPYAFQSCNNLTSVTIPPNVTSIGCCAFYDCENLSNVDFECAPVSYLTDTYINEDAEIRYNGMYYAEWESAVAECGWTNTRPYTPFPFPEGGPYKQTVDGLEWSFVIGTNLEAVVGTSYGGTGRAVGYDTKGSIVVPTTLGGRTVTSIGWYAFYFCDQLTSVTIPSSVRSIGCYAFYGCSRITVMTIPMNVTSIGGAFYICDNLSTVYFEGAPPLDVASAGVNRDATIRYNVAHEADWLPVVAECGWTNAKSYYPTKLLPDGGPYTEVVDGIEWRFNVANGIARLVDPAVPYSTVGSVDVPKMLGGRDVTTIGEQAFRECCDGLTRITIPSSVTCIERRAFYCCSGLMDISVSKDNVAYADLDGVLFSKNLCNLVCFPCGRSCEYEVPAGVRVVDESAFECCGRLTNVTIPPSVTSIGEDAFWACSSLTNVTMASVTSIGEGAFGCCDSLTSVSIPSSVTSIGYNAFYSCSALKSVTIPHSVTNIGEYAFYNSGLTAVDFEGAPPTGVANAAIKQDAAIRYNITYQDAWKAVSTQCGWTNAVPYYPVPLSDGGPYTETVDGIEWTFMVVNGEASVGTGRYRESAISVYTKDAVVIPAMLGGCSVTRIADCAFDGCSAMSAVTIPSSVTSIGSSAFSYCETLSSVDLPEGVTNIAAGTFAWCTGLSYVSIPDGVKSIGEGAFAQCYDLSYVYIPSNVTSIGWHAFEGCNNIDGVYISDMAAWCRIYFDDAMSNPLCYAKKMYLQGAESGPNIPQGVKDIGQYAFCGHWFEGCGVTLPPSVTNIGQYAFAGCAGLTDAVIPEGVLCIADGVFSGCSRLADVAIPTSVTSIGDWAFSGCSSLSSISIPTRVTDIGEGAFWGCSGLGDGVVIVDGCVLTVNGDCPSTVVLANGVRTIAGGAFQGTAIESMVISDSVKNIGLNAFAWCGNFSSVDFKGAPPSGLKNASVQQHATIRYNVEYRDAWLPIIADCGFENASSYDPHAPVVSNVVARQRYPWNGKVDIGFRISETGMVARTLVVCAVDRDFGTTNIAETVTGDVVYAEGVHHVVWDMLEDGISLISSNVVFGVAYVVDSVEMPAEGGGWSDEVAVDLTQGARVAARTEELAYSTDWVESAGDDAVAEVTIDGTVISAETGCGVVAWKPKRDGVYKLTHTVKTNGVVVGDVLTATFIAEGINPKTPVVSPASGTTFDTSLTVSMTCESEGATIHYTTNGLVPTLESPAYSRKFKIYGKTTVKAIAIAEDGTPSEVAVAEYAKWRDDPVIRPADGTVFRHSGQRVSITRDVKDGVVRYTTDGSEPTAASAVYVGPFAIDETTTVKAKVFGDQCFDSDVLTATLTREWVKLPPPVIAAASAFTGSKQKVVLSCATAGATIYYTLDGSEPTAASPVYEKPFYVTGNATVKAIAVMDDYLGSDIATFAIAKVWGIGDTMGKPDHAFATSGDTGFVRVEDKTATLGESMKSGAITDEQKSILSTTVMGPGTLTFKWKASCEQDDEYEWDHGEFKVDGKLKGQINGVTGWTEVSQRIDGDGEHTVTWTYVKDDVESVDQDCIWVSDYAWASDYTETQTTDVPVPYEWLRTNSRDAVDEYGVYECVAKQKAYNPRYTVEQCYVAGLDPESTTNEFTATIGPDLAICWKPDLKTERNYKVWGKAALDGTDDWACPTNALHRFFKVTVEMP